MLESDAVYLLSESFPNSSSKSKSSWDVLAGGLGIGNSLLWGTEAIEDGIEGYTMSRRFLVFLNLDISTIQK